MDFLLELSSNRIVLYFIHFLGSFGDAFIFTNVFIHGEIFFLSAGYLSSIGKLNIIIVYYCLVFGGVLGDNISYFIGQKYGLKLFRKSNHKLTTKILDTAEKFFQKHGEKAVFLSRLMGPVSWIVPTAAGLFEVPYKKFVLYNFFGVSVGIGLFLSYGILIGLVFEYLSSFIILYSFLFFGLFFLLYKICEQRNKRLDLALYSTKLVCYYMIFVIIALSLYFYFEPQMLVNVFGKSVFVSM